MRAIALIMTLRAGRKLGDGGIEVDVELYCKDTTWITLICISCDV